MTLIEQFYEQCGKKYGITLKQMEDICTTPFRMLCILIENDDNIASVRLEYLGLFKLAKRRLTYHKYLNQKEFDEGKITREVYEKTKTRLEETLNLIDY